jgi:mutator protein MutT
MTKAVAFLLVKDGKFLAEKRKDDKEEYPGMLAVPGGRMEEGETTEDTLIREMREELSVVPLEYGYYLSLEDPDAYGGLVIHYFWVKRWEGKISSGEAEELIWLDLENNELIEVAIDREAVKKFIVLNDGRS